MPPRSEPSAPIDLNILPERYRPQPVPPAWLLVWGIAILLLVLVLPTLYLAHASGQRAAQAQVALQTAHPIASQRKGDMLQTGKPRVRDVTTLAFEAPWEPPIAAYMTNLGLSQKKGLAWKSSSQS